jgi:hypothetical protein
MAHGPRESKKSSTEANCYIIMQLNRLLVEHITAFVIFHDTFSGRPQQSPDRRLHPGIHTNNRLLKILGLTDNLVTRSCYFFHNPMIFQTLQRSIIVKP